MMQGVKIAEGWADKLKVGSEVIVEDRELPERRSDGYRIATVQRVSPTSVVVDGVSYRRGPGRSLLVRYRSEGLEVARLTSTTYGAIHPSNKTTRAWLAALTAADDMADALAALKGDARTAVAGYLASRLT